MSQAKSTRTKQQRREIQERQRAAKVQEQVSPSANKFLLIRHGETDWNAEHRLQGQRDPPLNGIGIKQAEALSSRLGQEGFCGPLYSSDLARASQTAEIVAKGLDVSNFLPVTKLAAFRERNLGVLEVGNSFRFMEYIQHQCPNVNLQMLSPYVQPLLLACPVAMQDLIRQERDQHSQGMTAVEAACSLPEEWGILCSPDQQLVVPGGESAADVEKRAIEGILEVSRKHPGGCVAVITHGGVLQALYGYATGGEGAGRLQNCAVNTLWIDRGNWKVGVWGDTAHLEGGGFQTGAFAGEWKS